MTDTSVNKPMLQKISLGRVVAGNLGIKHAHSKIHFNLLFTNTHTRRLISFEELRRY